MSTIPFRKAVFFDRDGVLNQPVFRGGKPHSPAHLNEFRIVPGAREALVSLRAAGFLLIVATNQPNVARGLQPQSLIENMHEKLRQHMPLDDIRVCYHDDHHQCDCRKPQPGLLLSAAGEWGIQLGESFMVGDRQKDVEAGRRAGCKTILIRCPYNMHEPQTADFCASSLFEAAEWILSRDLK